MFWQLHLVGPLPREEYVRTRLGKASRTSQGGELYIEGREPLKDLSQGNDLGRGLFLSRITLSAKSRVERLGTVGPFMKLLWSSSR